MREKTVLVTGGASGIGKRAAELFAADGAFVAIADVDEVSGAKIVGSIGESRCLFLPLDVSDEKAVAAAMADIGRRRGAIDVVFNNAGVADPRPSVVDVDPEQFRRVVEVILLGSMLVTKHAIPWMKKRGGAIINTTSVTGLSVSGGSSVYAAAKAGLINYTRYAAVELGPFSIRVNGVCPGGVVTPLLLASMGADDESADLDAIRLSVRSSQISEHVNEPEDIANAVLYLASERARGITGHNLVVDGGYLVANRSTG